MKKLLLALIICCGITLTNAQTITTIIGNGTNANAGDGGLATAASVNLSYDIAFDGAGNKYITSYGANRVRKVDAATGIITTICGNGVAASTGDGGLASAAQINQPMGIAIDNANNIYIAEYGGHKIRKINGATGIITTIVGTGVGGFNGNGLLGTATQINNPWGLALDASSNLYFVDRSNYRIRKLTVSSGLVTTLAGTGTNSSAGDGGLATSATLGDPIDMDVDNAGNVYWAEFIGQKVRKITVSSGIVTSIAGTGVAGYNGDGILATTAQLNGPTAVLVDQNLNVFISDYTGQRLRKITAATGSISTVCGTGVLGFSGDGGLATSARIYGPIGMAGNGSDLYFADLTNYRFRKITNLLTCGMPPVPTNNTPAAQQNICSGNSGTLGGDRKRNFELVCVS